MIIKALLPLIAVLKFKYDGLQGQHFGKEVAQVYKACKEELRPSPDSPTNTKT